MTEYIIEWSGIGSRITELMGSETPCLAVKHLRDERRREQIVRCRDCRHYAGNEGLCMRLFNAMAVEPHGFCAWGLRRNDTENGMEVE